MYDDWLCILAAENLQRISEAMEDDQIFLTTETVEYIFTVCVRLRLPQEIKYLAAIIFNKFMLVHVDDLYKTVYETPHPIAHKQNEWERIEANISRQIPLRILSAIQIASKLHSYHDSLSRSMVKLALKTLGYAYTVNSVMRSEIRILSSLDWNVSSRQSPLVYAETLLKMLGSILTIDSLRVNCRKAFPERRLTRTFNTAAYWQFTLLCMDCVFMFWDEILERMLINVLGVAGNNFPRSVN
ncbi:unnamed protein product [Anisakis simplex]|uniref:Cyclin N-terminal domain-containing protein n=1 Tax=Anisakis simplex TaxID=6269 RepID=A0A0M3K007_ANISI|nr:unnamed protein product [Anisakis simplex]